MSLLSRIPRRINASGTAIPEQTTGASIWTDTGVNFDVAIGGLPFRLATDPDNPLIRRTAQYRKQQVDQSQEPGEQSIAQWWIKSQSTFHLGAGQKFIDSPTPGGEAISELRYATSTGIDPWTIGQASLLSQTGLALSSATGSLMTADADGAVTRFLVAAGATLTRVTETVSAGVPVYTTAAVTWGGSGTILALVTDGSNYYVADSAGIYRGTLTGSSPGTGVKIYTLDSGTNNVVLGWVKSRLVGLINVGGGTPTAKVYTFLSFPTSPPVALPTANYTHPNTMFKWTCITEGPSAIYAAGYAGNKSEIYRFTLSGTGDMPTLTGASSVAVMPASELVLGMIGKEATSFGVVTTRGMRIGNFADSGAGDVSIGPLSVRSTTLSGGIMSSDRFFFCAGTHADGKAGIFRVDTSQQLSVRQFSYTPDQIFGWAPDLRAADASEVPIAGQAGQMGATVDGRSAFLVPGFGLYVQHPSKVVPSGTLTTSRIRYQTLDPKLFRFVRVRGEAEPADVDDRGTITVSISTDDSLGEAVGILRVGFTTDTEDLAINLNAALSATVSFTLERSSEDNTISPILNSYQFKALPAQRRQREVILPLSIFDNELDNTGQMLGQEVALQRLRKLELMEDASDIVTLQFLSAFSDQELNEFVVIDNIDFRETTDPTTRQGWGGIAMVTCRTIA